MTKQANNSDLPKIGAPATRALRGVGITNLEEVAKKTEKELLSLHGVGPNAIRILKAEMEKNGLSFRKILSS